MFSDLELITGLHDGNEIVFETVFKNYYERLCNYANTYINNMIEAEEMVQGTFLILWEKHEMIDIHTSLKSYLYRSVHNNCINHVKHLQVRRNHYDEYLHYADIEYEQVSNDLIGKELEQKINSVIESLPPQCKAVFKLSRLENLTYNEIAEKMGLSVKTIENHMIKALKTLRVELKEYLPLLIWLLWFKNVN
ncbi:MAG TPA: RNA polymerase sigma-70 factor [Bacteroidales bacterium]|nr:RNA polymerase sigma-70 factor [Bacteroidales bacterium]